MLNQTGSKNKRLYLWTKGQSHHRPEIEIQPDQAFINQSDCEIFEPRQLA